MDENLGETVEEFNKMQYGVKLGEWFVNHLTIADDFVLVAKSKEEVEKMMQLFVNNVMKINLSINAENANGHAMWQGMMVSCNLWIRMHKSLLMCSMPTMTSLITTTLCGLMTVFDMKAFHVCCKVLDVRPQLPGGSLTLKNNGAAKDAGRLTMAAVQIPS